MSNRQILSSELSGKPGPWHGSITLQLRSALEKTSIYISAMNKDEQDIHSYVGAALYHIFVLIICYRYRTSTGRPCGCACGARYR
jgi:hypothetical protein